MQSSRRRGWDALWRCLRCFCRLCPPCTRQCGGHKPSIGIVSAVLLGVIRASWLRSGSAFRFSLQAPSLPMHRGSVPRRSITVELSRSCCDSTFLPFGWMASSLVSVRPGFSRWLFRWRSVWNRHVVPSSSIVSSSFQSARFRSVFRHRLVSRHGTFELSCSLQLVFTGVLGCVCRASSATRLVSSLRLCTVPSTPSILRIRHVRTRVCLGVDSSFHLVFLSLSPTHLCVSKGHESSPSRAVSRVSRSAPLCLPLVPTGHATCSVSRPFAAIGRHASGRTSCSPLNLPLLSQSPSPLSIPLLSQSPSPLSISLSSLNPSPLSLNPSPLSLNPSALSIPLLSQSLCSLHLCVCVCGCGWDSCRPPFTREGGIGGEMGTDPGGFPFASRLKRETEPITAASLSHPIPSIDAFERDRDETQRGVGEGGVVEPRRSTTTTTSKARWRTWTQEDARGPSKQTPGGVQRPSSKRGT